MIKKETFVKLMGAVKEQEVEDERIGRAIDVLGGGANNSFVYTTKLSEYVLKDLEVELEDKWGTISYYIYELKWGANPDSLSILDEDENDITPKTLGDLYDYLIKYGGSYGTEDEDNLEA